MKRIIFTLIFIFSVFVFSVSAQNPAREVFEKGLRSANNGNFEAALGEFQNSLELVKKGESNNDFHAKIHFNIGVCFYKLKKYEQSAVELERAILLAPNYEKAFYALGMTYAELKNWQTAEQAFLGAIRINKRNGETWFDLAFVYLAQKNYGAARQAFEKSIKLQSVDAATGHNNLGVILAMNGDLNGAVREFQNALKRSNGNLTVADRNLQFCKTLGQNSRQDLVAKLEFKTQNIGEDYGKTK